MTDTFQPDELITSITVTVHTADVGTGGTDDDVYIELFDWPKGIPNLGNNIFSVEIDTDGYNDFERGDTKDYPLPTWYFNNCIVNDIRRICVHKSKDGLYGGWALGWITVRVNNKILFSNYNPDQTLTNIWLKDDNLTWCAYWQPIEFEAPLIATLGLPDAGSNQEYTVHLTAKGGRKPLKWQLIASTGNAFTSQPQLKPLSGNTDGTEMIFSAHTVTTSTIANWSGTIQVTDADGRHSQRDFSMQVIFKLPPPTISSFTPEFGWPARSPAAPEATIVTVAGQNFDSRKPSATKVFFAGNNGSIEVKVVEITSSQLRVAVPKGAVPGSLTVKTDFGQANSSKSFTAHPDGYCFLSGFSFPNTEDEEDETKDGFPSSYAWERYEQTFGVCSMWICAFGQATIPNPVATLLYLGTKGTISDGCCHGFSLTSLQMKKGLIPTTGFDKQGESYPLDNSLWDLTGRAKPSSGLSKLIQSRQLVNFSDEAISYFLSQLDAIPKIASCEMDARPALNDMKNAIAFNLADPRMLAFAKSCSFFTSHVVVPYNMEANGQFQNIFVYDSNNPAKKDTPDDLSRCFKINPSNGDWSYNFDGAGNLWNGRFMFTIPLSAYGHQYTWSLPGLGTILGALGEGLKAFLFGCACIGGSGEIAQVTDEMGKTLLQADGSVNPDQSLWPQGVRPVPTLGIGSWTPKMVVLTKPTPVFFTVKHEFISSGEFVEPTFFSVIQGADFSLSIEDVTTSINIRFNPANKGIEVSPTQGTTSAILRFCHRFHDMSESLTYAVRVHNVAAGKPITAFPAQDGRAITLVAHDTALAMDMEVTHTNRIGEQKILESGGISTPPKSVATFEVSNYEDLDQPNQRPLVLNLDADGTGRSISRQQLGQNLTGLTVVAPHRVILDRPTISLTNSMQVASAMRTVTINVSGSKTAFPRSSMRFRSLYGNHILSQEAGTLTFQLPPGTHPIQLVAEDNAGHRSFPHTVFVTVPGNNERVISPLTLFGEDMSAVPGSLVMVPLGAFVTDFPTNRIVVDLSIRQRLSGLGSVRLQLQDTGFDLSPELKAMGAVVNATVATDGLTLHLEISWNPSGQRVGRIDLGQLPVQIPTGVFFGNTFILAGTGLAFSRTGRAEQSKTLNVLPTLVRIWGGPEPTSLAITGPKEVSEMADIAIQATAPGVPANAQNAGWWIEPMSGDASITQDQSDSTRITLTGLRAGLVKLHAIVGAQTVETLIHVLPTVMPILLPIPGITRSTNAIPLLKRK